VESTLVAILDKKQNLSGSIPLEKAQKWHGSGVMVGIGAKSRNDKLAMTASKKALKAAMMGAGVKWKSS
jgi:hypothetical protein